MQSFIKLLQTNKMKIYMEKQQYRTQITHYNNQVV